MKRYIWGYVAILLVGLAIYIYTAFLAPKELHWIAAHNPTNPEIQTLLEEFSTRVEQSTEGAVRVRVEYLDDNTQGRHTLGISSVMNGKAEASQVSLAELYQYSHDLEVMGLPYFFDSHEKVNAIINGPVGEELLDGLYINTDHKLRALAFTYSGGFRVFYGHKKIQSVADLKGLRVPRAELGPSRDFFDLLETLYVDNARSRLEAIELHANGEIDIEENEINRLAVMAEQHPEFLNYVKYVTETNHTLYLTAIIVNAKFMESLGPELEQKVRDEIHWLAEKERTRSIAQAEASKKQLMEKGVTFLKLNAPAQELMIRKAKQVQEEFRALRPELMARIDEAVNTAKR